MNERRGPSRFKSRLQQEGLVSGSFKRIRHYNCILHFLVIIKLLFESYKKGKEKLKIEKGVIINMKVHNVKGGNSGSALTERIRQLSLRFLIRWRQLRLRGDKSAVSL